MNISEFDKAVNAIVAKTTTPTQCLITDFIVTINNVVKKAIDIPTTCLNLADCSYET